jgi:hypothetical protein
MVDGVDVAEVLMLVVPTLLVAAAVVVVELAYTGAEVALDNELVKCSTNCH